ncbi:MAG: pitrilysin family protein [Bacteroidota bacterium]
MKNYQPPKELHPEFITTESKEQESITDHNTPPETKPVQQVKLIKATENRLDNGIPIYVIDAGTQDVVKIEFIFPAGVWYPHSPLIASTANAMLNEGTAKYTADQIAEKIDNYGAFLEMNTENDFAYISIYTLNKHLKNILPVFEDMLKNSIFPKREFKTLVQNKKQRFIVNNEKVGFIAQNKFNEILFGNNHPYGYNVTINDFDKLKHKEVMLFYEKYYKRECKIIAAGKIRYNLISLLNKHFGVCDWSKNLSRAEAGKGLERKVSLPFGGGGATFIGKKDALQSAIRIGKTLFNKKHPDYMGMQVLNTVLGGYFGSRLMTNIREDKGYTYGIYSTIVSLQNAGYFFISTEAGIDVCNMAVDEIYREIKHLRNELIPGDELQLVKNYMLGAFLRSIDGPFALSDKFKGIMEYGLDYNYYSKLIKTIKDITPVKLNELANKYLQQDDMCEIVVGSKGVSKK